MKIKAIPTSYNGTRFRSRLEARWAAYFDLVKISWDYEPCDMDGWCPDFILRALGEDIYAEVKPVELRDFDGLGLHLPDNEQPSVFAKAKRHCKDVWVLALGNGPQADFFGAGSLMDPPPKVSTRWLDMHDALAATEQRKLWREAGNRVQWVGATQ